MIKFDEDYLNHLESESIHIIREAFSEAENAVMLYSLGKDSSVMLQLVKKAFYPSKIPFPLMHVDTTWKFKDMYKFRDDLISREKLDFIIYKNELGIKNNINPFDHPDKHTEIWKTDGLKKALNHYNFDIIFGGARRDEEKSRAKERVFSIRNTNHQWDPKLQRPELWNLYNIKKNKGETIRVFPLSNWTEFDIWMYIYREKIKVVPLYFAKERKAILRDKKILMIDDDRFVLKKNEKPIVRSIRFRSLGCYPLTAGIYSNANNIEDLIEEMYIVKTSERSGRLIDSEHHSSMEEKKRDGYF